MTCKLLVVTDLDGSLLDHHSYSYEQAMPALKLLARKKIPLILSSSKTAAEIQSLRRLLDNHAPYIVENGGGIYLPDDSSGARGGKGQEKRVSFGMNRADILSVLGKLRKKHEYAFTGFSDMDEDELIHHTGLDREAARQALIRDFTEPLLWQDTEERFLAFCGSLREAGLRVVKGGRFIHVSAPTDKGQALQWLRGHYRDEKGKKPCVIALGDGENDIPMLEAADYPVVIRSPVNPALSLEHKKAIYTRLEGPAGWNEAVTALVSKLTDK